MDERIKQAFEAIFPGVDPSDITPREHAILSVFLDVEAEATQLQAQATTWRARLGLQISSFSS